MIHEAWKRNVLATALVTMLAIFVCCAAFADGPPGAQHRVQQTAPIFLGVSGLNVKIGCAAGTLGSRITDGSTNYILSNNHVMVLNNAGTKGDAIVHLAPLDDGRGPGCVGPPPPTVLTVATLTDFVTIRPLPANNIMDAAVAAVATCGTKPCVDLRGLILDLGAIPKAGLTDTGGPVSTTTVLAAVNLQVQKSGRTTGLTSAPITAVDVTIVVGGYPPPLRQARFIDQFRFSGPTQVCQGGDSGSLVVDTASPPHPVGLFFAGSTNGVTDFCFANPINVVLATFSARLGGTVTFLKTHPGMAQQQMTTDTEFQDPRVQAAVQVKRSYDNFLMQLPEVVGHGVGLSNSGSGEVVIKVFLRSATPTALAAVPTMLGGIRVEAEVTGEIRAY